MTSYKFTSTSRRPTGVVQSWDTGDLFIEKIVPTIYLSNPDLWEILPVSATFWNSVANIRATYGNNTFIYTTQLAPAAVLTKTIILPDGFYSLYDIHNNLVSQMSAFGDGSIVNPRVRFTADQGSSRAIITILKDTVNPNIDLIIKFTDILTTGLRTMLGFPATDLQIVGAATSKSFYGTTAASMSSVDNILINCSLADKSYIGGTNTGTLFVIPLSEAKPNSQGLYMPGYDTDTLSVSQSSISDLTFWLSDESNNRISLGGNPYTVSFNLRLKSKDKQYAAFS